MLKSQINDELRARMAQIALDAYEAAGFEVLQTAGGTWYVPCLDQNGDESWFKLSAIIPTKVNEDDGTDGYSLATEYKLKKEKKAEIAAKKKKEK